MDACRGKKALVLSALAVDERHGPESLAALQAALADRGFAVATVDCATVDVIPCTGCASCGMRTPGACAVKDDMQDVFRMLVASDLLVLATPVRFGSYCSALKKVVDRFQPLMVPIYVMRGDEMHFRSRYDLPALLGVGVPGDGGGPGGAVTDGAGPGGAAAEEEAEAFRFLIGRLAVNLDTSHAAVMLSGSGPAAARAGIERALDAVEKRTP